MRGQPGTSDASPSIVCLARSDNVLIAIRSIASGEKLVIDGHEVRTPHAVEIGHKLARYDLDLGTIVRRYGMPIGRITRQVRIGELVHVHNLESRYIGSTRRDAPS